MKFRAVLTREITLLWARLVRNGVLRALSVALLVTPPLTAHAENSLFVLPFGGEPGAAVPHAYNYGAFPFQDGTYAMRIPNVDADISPIFADTELTIDTESKTVLRVHAERAYRAVADCSAAQQVLAKKLALALVQPYTGAEPQWQYQSIDGTQVGGAYCRQERYLPFSTLILDLSMAPRRDK